MERSGSWYAHSICASDQSYVQAVEVAHEIACIFSVSVCLHLCYFMLVGYVA